MARKNNYLLSYLFWNIYFLYADGHRSKVNEMIVNGFELLDKDKQSKTFKAEMINGLTTCTSTRKGDDCSHYLDSQYKDCCCWLIFDVHCNWSMESEKAVLAWGRTKVGKE